MNSNYSSNKAEYFIDTSRRIKCKACGLHLNQLPVVDKKKIASVFWVGLSSVLIPDNEERIPLSPHTRSGALIKEIEKPFEKNVSFYRTNVVKCLPLDTEDKIRYPFKHEMEKCYPNLEAEIEALNPNLIFLLGKQVGTFVFRKLNINEIQLREDFIYDSVEVNNIRYVVVHHPSYILVYKRKFINDYMNGIGSHIRNSSCDKIHEDSICEVQLA